MFFAVRLKSRRLRTGATLRLVASNGSTTSLPKSTPSRSCSPEFTTIPKSYSPARESGDTGGWMMMDTFSRVPGTMASVFWLKVTHAAGIPVTPSVTRSTTRPRFWMTAVAKAVPPGSTGVSGEVTWTRMAADGASSIGSSGAPSGPVSGCSRSVVMAGAGKNWAWTSPNRSDCVFSTMFEVCGSMR